MKELMEQDQELFQAWKDHPMTKFLMQWASARREDLKERWASGHFSAAFDTEMLVKNAAATGSCSILQLLIELDYNDLMSELKNE